MAGNAVIETIGTIVFLARIYSRFMINNSWKRDDYVLLGAWVRSLFPISRPTADAGLQLFATAYSFCQYEQVHHGAGRHIGAIIEQNPFQVVQMQKYAFAATLIALFALALPKLSICITYLRIFHTDVLGRRLIQSIMVVILVPLVVFFFLMLFQCNPIEVYWTEGRPADKCSQDLSGIYVIGSLNVGVDLALIAVVLPRVLDLQLQPRQKWVLVAIVGLGSFAAMAGLVRMIRVGMVLANPNFDPTWDAYDISIWTSTEIYVSLICASAPGTKPLVTQLMPKLLGSSPSSWNHSGSGSTRPSSVGTSSKPRRGTIGSNRIRPRKHDTFVEDEGPYEQVGTGLNWLSLDETKGADETNISFTDPFKGTIRTQEVTIRTSLIGLAR